MLVAKLDYLQLLAVKGVLGWLGRQAQRRFPLLRPPRPPPADDADDAAAPGGRHARPDSMELNTMLPVRSSSWNVRQGP